MKHVLFFIVLFHSQVLFSQETLLLQFSNSITKEELSEHVYMLASDKFDGRYTGSEGQRLAAEYIQDEFREDGLYAAFRATSNPFFQAFELNNCYWTGQSIVAGNDTLKTVEDFVFLSDPDSINGNFQIVFAGFGIDDPAYSDYRDLDVKGKVVMAISGEPEGNDGKYLISGSSEHSRKSYYFSKLEVARDKGALGLIIVARDEKNFRKYTKHEDALFQPVTSYHGDGDPEDVFCIYANAETGARLLELEPVKMESIMQQDSEITSNSGKLTGSAQIKGSLLRFPLKSENVIGVIPGTDLRDQAVVVIAHYDHLGQKDGKIYYGADDNASGTAALMEIGEAFVQAVQGGYQPRRTVFFIAATAEETGLYGSRYYTENPVIPLDSTYACVNIDMIGRTWTKFKDEPQYIGGYVYESPGLFKLVQDYNKLMAPDLKDRVEFRKNLQGGSDHYHFGSNGVPSVFYFTGIHKDYHEPTDTPDKLLYDRMETTVRAIFATVWALANGDEELRMKNEE